MAPSGVPFHMDRVLVPMDDSEGAEQALAYALDELDGSEITVIHVAGAPSMMMGAATSMALEDDLETAARERAEPVFERARELASERGRDVETAVGIGHPAHEVLDRAEDYDAIVIGAHGSDRGRLSHRVLVGNVAETIAKRAPVPVTIVR